MKECHYRNSFHNCWKFYCWNQKNRIRSHLTNYLDVLMKLFLFNLRFTANAIKCWRCSSDASNAAFCDDPFDASIISDQQRRWSYVECSYPPGQQNPYSANSNQRAVCKKVKQLGKSSNHIKSRFAEKMRDSKWAMQFTLNYTHLD